MQGDSHRPLWQLTAAAGLQPARTLSDTARQIPLRALDGGTTLSVPVAELRGRAVLLLAKQQMAAAMAMLELDGVASRLVLCPPDLAPSRLADIITQARVEIVLADDEAASAVAGAARFGVCGLPVRPASRPARPARRTEWLLFTSGTSGRPKLVSHSLASLTGPMRNELGAAPAAVWSTFYDIRRYGGLQILLRALLGGGSMVFSEPQESLAGFLARAGARGVSHISGTPSHWRRALMSPALGEIAPSYIRLSGEVADQAILDQLGRAFPAASIAHAFASTEAGVAFDVRDGLEGFPATLVDAGDTAAVALRVQDGSLRIRSSRLGSHYLGARRETLADEEGFIDTGDMVALRDGRYHFIGRRGGVINVGGNKVYPEEVEEVINRHPGVQMSLVQGRRNPITGALVVADVVVRPNRFAGSAAEPMRREILQRCRQMLPPHKVPAILRLVASLEVAPSGKLQRPHA